MGIKHKIGKVIIPRLPVSRLTFDLLRHELNAIRNRLGWNLLPHRIIRKRRLRKLRGVYVNLGSGGWLLPGFLHLDLYGGAAEVIRWDCCAGLPFGDGSARGIRVEHFVEHVEPRQHLPRLLAECYRVLEVGGTLRIVVPDAERFLKAYADGSPDAFAPLGFPPPFPSDLPTRMDLVNHVFHQWHEHRWGYDFETLEHRLRAAGFETVLKRNFGESDDPMLRTDREQHKPYSLYVDAVRQA